MLPISLLPIINASTRRRFRSFSLIFLRLPKTVFQSSCYWRLGFCSRDSLSKRNISHSDQAAKFHQDLRLKILEISFSRKDRPPFYSSGNHVIPSPGLQLGVSGLSHIIYASFLDDLKAFS